MKKELLLFFIRIVMSAPQNNKNKKKTHTETTTPIIESRERGLQDLIVNYPIKTPILHTELPASAGSLKYHFSKIFNISIP